MRTPKINPLAGFTPEQIAQLQTLFAPTATVTAPAPAKVKAAPVREVVQSVEIAPRLDKDGVTREYLTVTWLNPATGKTRTWCMMAQKAATIVLIAATPAYLAVAKKFAETHQ